MKTFDPNDKPVTTLKETYINNNHSGNYRGTNNSYTFDPTDVPATTLKEILCNCYNLGIAKGEINKSYTRDPNDIPATTLKEMFINNNYLGNINKTNTDGYKIANIELATTLRSIHNIFYQGIINGKKKPKDYSGKVCIDDKKNNIEKSLEKIVKLNKYGFPVIADKNNIGEYYAKDNATSGRVNSGSSANQIIDKENIGISCSSEYNNVGDRITNDINDYLKQNPYVNQLLTKFDN